MREYTIQEAITYLDSLIVSQKEKGTNKLGLELNIVGNDVADNITKYYNNQLIACTMKECVLRKVYEVIIWW